MHHSAPQPRATTVCAPTGVLVARGHAAAVRSRAHPQGTALAGTNAVLWVLWALAPMKARHGPLRCRALRTLPAAAGAGGRWRTRGTTSARTSCGSATARARAQARSTKPIVGGDAALYAACVLCCMRYVSVVRRTTAQRHPQQRRRMLPAAARTDLAHGLHWPAQRSGRARGKRRQGVEANKLRSCGSTARTSSTSAASPTRSASRCSAVGPTRRPAPRSPLGVALLRGSAPAAAACRTPGASAAPPRRSARDRLACVCVCVCVCV